MRLLGLAAVLTMAFAVAGTAAAAPTVTEFPAGLGPWGVTSAADGSVWFSDVPNPGAIGRLAAGGTVTTYNGGTPGFSKDAQPKAIAGASSGVWFTENGKNKVGRVAADGTITEFAGGNHDHPTGITAGPDGNIWFVATGKHGAVLRMTPTGAVTEWGTPTQDGNPADITVGPDGNLWFTEPAKKRIGRITPLGTITEFDGTAVLGGGAPQQIVTGPDGNLWFTVTGTTPGIGRISTTGSFWPGLFTAGLPMNAALADIAAGADGNLYFTDSGANAIGRITPSGTITEHTAGISANAGLQGLATGGDGRIWFAENGTAKIGRLSVAPSVGAVGVAGVTDVQAELSATVAPNSEATTYHFEWGKDGIYTDATAESAPITGAGAQAVTATASGLSYSSSYSVRVVATNASGTTSGPATTFSTTDPGAPSATTLAATDVDAGAALLNASVNPEGVATDYHFQWGTEPGTWLGAVPVPNASLPAGYAAVGVSAPLSGLEPNTTYRYRVVATSTSGTTYGAVETFTTGAILPVAATSVATAVTADGATLAGTVDPGHSATTYRFEWGMTDAYGSSVPVADELVGDDHAVHGVTQPLTGLAPSTTYHFRVVATNAAGVAVGQDRTFTTAAIAPAAATAAADAISASGATLHAQLNPYNDPTTTYRFEWGTTTDYGEATAALPLDGPVDASPREVRADVTGLAPGTLYHFRVVATSSGGATAGQDAWFSTEAAPPAADGGTGTTPPAPADSPTTLGDGPGAPGAGPAPVPQLGKTAVADVVAGTVRIRRPGSATAVPLTGAAAIPAGSIVDARRGTLALESALDARGRRQEAQFRGAVFRVGLAKKGGMVDLTLTERPTGCASRSTPRARPRAATAAKKRKRAPSLWGKDSKGKYRTHGRNSVATVRGTEWVTTETCAGTLTRVVHGAVAVRDLRTKKTRLVRAGHRYLARARR